jgi:WD40 repeat protein
VTAVQGWPLGLARRDHLASDVRGGNMAYDAFISYSHAADGRLAPALQRAMQRLAKPWYRARALRVFRDESALSANPHLWASIEVALDESAWFVLLASPDAAGSQWVNRELAHWLATKPVDRILVVLTDGTWEWDRNSHAVVGTAVPQALRGVFTDEPRHVDLRWARSETDLDMHNTQFRDAAAQLAAPVHGIAKDDLESEDVRLHRRGRRLARGGVSVLALLVAISLITSVFALVQRGRANHNAGVANHRASIATAERLAALATARSTTDQAQSLLLAVEGYRRDDSRATRSALLSVLQANSQLVRVEPASEVNITAMDTTRDGKMIAVGYEDGRVRVRDVASGKSRMSPQLAPEAIRALAFAEDGSLFVTLSVSGHIRAWDSRSFQPRSPAILATRASSQSIQVSRARDVIVAGDTEPFSIGIQGWRLTSAASLARRGTPSLGFFDTPSVVPAALAPIAMDPRGQRVALGFVVENGAQSPASIAERDTGNGSLLGLSRLGSGTRSTPPAECCGGGYVSAVAYSPDGKLIAGGRSDGGLGIVLSSLGSSRGRPAWFVEQGHRGLVTDLAFSSDGRALAASSADGTVSRWDVATGHQIGVALPANSGPVLSVGWESGGSASTTAERLVAATQRGVFEWNADSSALGPTEFRLRRPGRGPSISDIAAHGSGVLVAGDAITMYDVTSRAAHQRWSADPMKAKLAHYGRAAITPGGDLAAIAYKGYSGREAPSGVVVLQTATGRVAQRIDTPQGGNSNSYLPSQSLPVAYSGDGSLLAFQSAGLVDHLLDISRRTITSTNSGDEYEFERSILGRGTVGPIAFSPDGRLLAGAVSNAELRIWDTATGVEQMTLSALVVNDVAFSADGARLFAATADGRVLVLDAQHDRKLSEINPNTGPLVGLAVSTARNLLATISQSGIVSIRNLTSEEPIGTAVFANPDGAAPGDGHPALAFANDGDTLAIESPGRLRDSVEFWDMRPSEWEHTACHLAGRNLTKAEWVEQFPDEPYRKTCAEWAAGK